MCDNVSLRSTIGYALQYVHKWFTNVTIFFAQILVKVLDIHQSIENKGFRACA